MGLAYQLGGFSSQLSQAAEPLRDLMKPRNTLLWTPAHNAAFEETKQVLCSLPVLASFDPILPTTLQTDASILKGLGFALLQKHADTWKFTQAGSRFTTDTESRYAMVELAVVWAICKCRIYLQGLPHFDVVLDHKPLESILNNQTMDMIDNPRIQRLKEKLSGYTFQTIWIKGKNHIIPDALFRAPCRDPTQEDLIPDENPDSFQWRVCAIFRKEKQSLIDAIIEEIKDSTRVDEESQALMAAIQDDFSSSNLRPSVKPF